MTAIGGKSEKPGDLAGDVEWALLREGNCCVFNEAVTLDPVNTSVSRLIKTGAIHLCFELVY